MALVGWLRSVRTVIGGMPLEGTAAVHVNGPGSRPGSRMDGDMDRFANIPTIFTGRVVIHVVNPSRPLDGRTCSGSGRVPRAAFRNAKVFEARRCRRRSFATPPTTRPEDAMLSADTQPTVICDLAGTERASSRQHLLLSCHLRRRPSDDDDGGSGTSTRP